MASETAMTTVDAPTDDVFEVEYGCDNCGGCWVESYPMETYVDDEECDGVVTYDGTSFSGSSSVMCPVCGLSKEVVVYDRRPIEDGDG
jgi:hypothetical protein